MPLTGLTSSLRKVIVIRSVIHPISQPPLYSFSQHRFVQTAFKPLPEDEYHRSASNTFHPQPEARSHPRKGKQRANPFREHYQFPLKAKDGGVPDPFEVLGVDRSASEKEVKQQCESSNLMRISPIYSLDYRLALMLHPDSAHSSSSQENFATLHRAYALLSSPDSRSDYLQTGRGWSSSTSSPSDTIEAMMRAEVLRRKRTGAGFRPSDAGQGAWGGYAGGDRWRAYNDSAFHGDVSTEPTYMSHPRFFGVLSVIVSSIIQMWQCFTVHSWE